MISKCAESTVNTTEQCKKVGLGGFTIYLATLVWLCVVEKESMCCHPIKYLKCLGMNLDLVYR